MKLKVKVENDVLKFADEHNNWCSIVFHRTLRLPMDDKIYPLPPSLGKFPICKIDDYLDKVPEEWKKSGGVFIPLYQREALWLGFSANRGTSYPFAMKIATGKINSVSGESWNQEIDPKKKQDYVVIPTQPWLDGINAGDGFIKQFVAMPKGSGYSIEQQVTGEDKFGGIQIITYAPKKEKFNPEPYREIQKPVLKPQPQPVFPQHPPPLFGSPSIVPFAMTKAAPMKKMKAAPKPAAPPINFATAPKNSFGPPAPPMGFAAAQEKMSFDFAPQMNDLSAPVLQSVSSLSSNSSISQQKPEIFDDLFESEPMEFFSAQKEQSLNFFDQSRSSKIKEKSRPIKKDQVKKVKAEEMSLSAGGKMKQDISKDPFGAETWDQNNFGRVFIHIVNSEMFKQITGKEPPPTPISASTYTSYGYPWYDFYSEDNVEKSDVLSNVKSIKEVDQEKYAWPQQDDSSVSIPKNQVHKINKDPNEIDDGDW